MEYIRTSVDVLPLVITNVRIAATDMRVTPFCIVNRSESEANLRGSHESVAIFPMTRGPSINPACAATNNRAASEASVITTKSQPIGNQPRDQFPANRSSNTAFIVLPETGSTLKRR